MTVVQSSTLGEPEAHGRLVTALENMARAEPAQLFAGRYRLKAEWVQGGQALVVFARDDADGFFQYAIKCGSVSSCTSLRCGQPAHTHEGALIYGKGAHKCICRVSVRCMSTRCRACSMVDACATAVQLLEHSSVQMNLVTTCTLRLQAVSGGARFRGGGGTLP